MIKTQEHSTLTTKRAIVTGVFLLLATVRCGSVKPARSEQSLSTLRVGAGQIELAPLIQFLTIEGLAKVTEEGRLDTRLAKQWTVAKDGLSVAVDLRPGVRFHDGSPVSARIVADTLQRTLPQLMGAAYGEDVSSIEPLSEDRVEINLRRPSSFVLESLEAPIFKPGTPDIGTGPFISVNSEDPVELRANPDYYLGRPTIERIVATKYPSVRTAWAELLRGHLDMVYELGADALDSVKGSTSINVFSFTRRYQYIILLNTTAPTLRSAAIRRALNDAIDRHALIQDALNGHGLPSTGPIWPKHWAAQSGLSSFVFDPQAAAKVLNRPGSTVKFKCVIAADEERLALTVKRQLEAVGAEMTVEEEPIDHIRDLLAKRDFDAILIDAISGPTLFRPYRWWHSHGSLNRGTFNSALVDATLDSIRHASSDDEYRAAIARFQQTIMDDPPAIFLAWDERARAVSNRFHVPADPGGDILGTLRNWRSVGEEGQPSSN